jgi:hypothetical protein
MRVQRPHGNGLGRRTPPAAVATALLPLYDATFCIAASWGAWKPAQQRCNRTAGALPAPPTTGALLGLTGRLACSPNTSSRTKAPGARGDDDAGRYVRRIA